MKYKDFNIIFILLLSLIMGCPKLAKAQNISAKAYVVASLDGQKVFLIKQPHEIRAIASLSKLVAAMVFMDYHLKLEDVTTMEPIDWKVALGGCRTRLRIKKSYKNKDLLHAALLSSDNRAISALGRAIGLSAKELTRAMNEKVKELGLKYTHFIEPTGISHENISTAWEMLTIVRAISKYQILKKVMRKSEYQAKEIETKRYIIYKNTNLLARKKEWGIFVTKTGYNDKALYNVAFAYHDHVLGNIAVIVLGSSSKLQRFRDAVRIIRQARKIYKQDHKK